MPSIIMVVVTLGNFRPSNVMGCGYSKEVRIMITKDGMTTVWETEFYTQLDDILVSLTNKLVISHTSYCQKHLSTLFYMQSRLGFTYVCYDSVIEVGEFLLKVNFLLNTETRQNWNLRKEKLALAVGQMQTSNPIDQLKR